MTLDPELVALRQERDALLLKDRGTKATKAWKVRYADLTVALNERAHTLRLARWTALKKEAK